MKADMEAFDRRCRSVNVKYIGLSEINGPLVALDHVSGISYDEMAEIKLDDGTRRLARVVEVEKDRAVLQVFEGTKGLSLVNTTTSFQGKPMELALSTEMLGRIFSGAGKAYRRVWERSSRKVP